MTEQTLRSVLNGVSPAYQAFLDLHPEGIEPFKGETLVADGWKYRDLPRLSETQMQTFKEVVGEANIRWLAHASGKHKGVVLWVRGQLFISPEGQQRLKAYLENPS